MNREANQKETTALDTSVGADVRQSLQNSTGTSIPVMEKEINDKSEIDEKDCGSFAGECSV